ncbi:prolipoprotein diacylglyceryl transferase [Candidatus Endolissoclinum faulkneri L5]|uniref:Phosphatidylglycerol--prolipoprotein diacylglyceryl transferase n=2 Tax=Candidatus Endolissoclinum faulkneri TaxID=1263979 RepID=V9TVJ3_9PROT|nr:prolipoprotein diacylglyceryl transferase [Candidatus Endolissoclinum faulkneri L5]
MIDPVAITMGPLSIRWYALAYIAGIIIGWQYVLYLIKSYSIVFETKLLDSLLFYVTYGVILGGRIGYVLLYNLNYYYSNPEEIFMVWRGGMSFHGGVLGVVLAIILFARKAKISIFIIGDLVASATPIGLFFGRIANFINGELFGRVAPDLPWAMIFPIAGDIPRHPSQIYEAILEGIVLFILVRGVKIRKQNPGMTMASFFIGYGFVRTICEFFRAPDVQLGFVVSNMTMGQLLSLPMILIGGIVMCCVSRKDHLDCN